LTHRVLEKELDQAIAQIEALPTIKEPIKRIRVESLG
jgi:hypothetical protein